MSSSFVIFSFHCGVRSMGKEEEIPPILRWQWQIQWDIWDHFFHILTKFFPGCRFPLRTISMVELFFRLKCPCVWLTNPLNISYCSVFNSLDESEISRDRDRISDSRILHSLSFLKSFLVQSMSIYKCTSLVRPESFDS